VGFATDCRHELVARSASQQQNPALKSLMRRIALYALILVLVSPSCSNRAGGRTTMVVKPKNHHWWFNKKKDKGKKRTRMVRMRN
jgi:hypothetical protein